jgi:hypothetical protein
MPGICMPPMPMPPMPCLQGAAGQCSVREGAASSAAGKQHSPTGPSRHAHLRKHAHVAAHAQGHGVHHHGVHALHAPHQASHVGIHQRSALHRRSRPPLLLFCVAFAALLLQLLCPGAGPRELWVVCAALLTQTDSVEGAERSAELSGQQQR